MYPSPVISVAQQPGFLRCFKGVTASSTLLKGVTTLLLLLLLVLLLWTSPSLMSEVLGTRMAMAHKTQRKDEEDRCPTRGQLPE